MIDVTQKYQKVKVQNDIRIRPNIYVNKQTSPIFNCVTPVNVSLTTLASQISHNLEPKPVHTYGANVLFIHYIVYCTQFSIIHL